MSGGPEPRWWNRDLPVRPIGILLGTVLVAGVGYLYLNPILRAWLWTVRHHSTATYRKLSVKVPWMWRQEETPAGQREIRLVRARWGEPASTEEILINAVSPRPPGTLMERLKIFTYKLGETDFRGEPLPLEPETATRYSCVVPHFDQLRDWQVSCISNDDLWSVTLYGTVSDIDDFLVVLRHLAAVQK